MPDGRVLQLPSTHFLGQNFAKAFGVYYQDQNGNRTPVWQTCYGPCISRIYGAMFCVHGDEKGLLLPFDFAPLQVVIVPIFGKGKDEQAIIKYSQEVLNVLERAKIRARLDLSPSTPGFKYNHWELLGVPIRVEIGEKELAGKSITVALRDSAAKISIPFDGFADAIIKEGKSLSSRLRAKADEYFNSHILDAKTMDELKSGLEKGCIVRVPYCSMEQDGKACADEIKSKLAGDVRGVRYPFEPIGEGERCIQCGRKALHWAYIARQY
jgi:prolyl-tRNA synthetase